MQKDENAPVQLDITAPGVARNLAGLIGADIDRYCVQTYDDGHRNHLGASLIGRECSRYLWYVFRWVYHKQFDGRMYRLFNRGHREEDRFCEWLRGIGCIVHTHNFAAKPLYYIAESNEYLFGDEIQETDTVRQNLAVRVTERKDFEIALKLGVKFPQFRISGVMGHFGGSLDGRGYLPARYNIPDECLFEFKTNGTGAKFTELRSFRGVMIVKPEHWAQQCVYGFKEKLKFSVYMNINKNDDDLHVEPVPLDWELGEKMEQKAAAIILAQEPPARMSENPTHFACKTCDFVQQCHHGKPAEKNCRSCRFARPVENAEWKCEGYNAVIPADFIKQGCGNWQSIAE